MEVAMVLDDDSGRPFHHVIRERMARGRGRQGQSPSDATIDLVAEIVRRYPNLESDRVHYLVHKKRHDVTHDMVADIMDAFPQTRRGFRRR